MSPKPVFLDVDSSIVEKNLLITKEDPAEDEFRRLFPTEKYESKVIKPYPGFCIKTKELGTETKIFVNICYTESLPPPPQDLTEEELVEVWRSEAPSEFRVPMSIGNVRPETDKKGNSAKAIDIAINDNFFNKVQKSSVFKQFVTAIAFEGLSNKHDLHTTDDRIELKNCKAYGTLQLHRIQQRDVEQIKSPLDELAGAGGSTSTKPKIETLSSITYNDEDSRIPEYRLFKKIDEPMVLYGEFQLLRVSNADDITLDIGEDRIILETKARYYFLDIFVPCSIDQDTVDASFNRSSKILTIRMGLNKLLEAAS